MKPKVALAMICKASEGELKHLERCINSVKDHVDGIFLNLNSDRAIPQSLQRKFQRVIGDGKLITTKWTGSFVKARTDSFAMVTDDFTHILWLDSDDTVDNPEKIREVCAVAGENVDGIYINYDYAHDDYGNVIVAHYNARVVKNNGTFAWKSSFEDSEVTVHETLNEVRGVNKVMNDEWKVIHHSDEERRDESLARNITLLEGMLDRHADNPDPRILFYLATHYVDAHFLARAQPLFEQYLKMSGWAEERSQAWVYLGDIYKAYGNKGLARGCYTKALAENPKDPMPYVELGELESEDRLWDKAIEWLVTATKKKQDLTAAVQRPMEASYRAYKLLAEAHTNQGAKGYPEALKWLKKAIKLRPYDPELLEARETVEKLQHHTSLNEAVLKIAQELKINEEDKIVPFLNNVPASLQDSPVIHSIRNYYRQPEVWPEKSIAIVCGTSAVGEWGPWSLKDGVGGSEEAVIQLSKELTTLGWKVTVYAIPGSRAGDHDGVRWKHFWEFSSRDTFDVLIGWRDPSLFDKKFSARKQYLWLHDVVDKEELTKERVENIDKIIFVSQYHRDIYELPEKKCFVSGNGIDPAQFEDNKIKRDPHKCIYMSAHERGLELLYKVWPDVRRAVPDATLDVYYGWGSFLEVNKDNPERMTWRDNIIKKEAELSSKGVVNHGKIGHLQIVERIYRSGVWAYPTPFPEVYCITGVKAQAGGAWPVCSDYGALKETVQYGSILPMPRFQKTGGAGIWGEKDLEKYKDELIRVLKNPPSEEQRQEMQNWAKSNMSWASTAGGWHREFSK